MRLRQRGVGMLVVVLLVLIVAAFAVIVAASQSGGDIYGSDANADGLQAMLLAETGIERALKRFATGTACNALGPETINDLTTIGLGNGTNRIVIGAGLPTDFAGATLPATQCRVPVTGTVLSRNVSRTVHAIIDRNLLGGITGAVPPAFNPAFNNPLTAGAPSSWTLTQPAGQNGYANNGGPDVIGAACSRSAYVLKNLTNNYEARAQGVANVNFTVTGDKSADTFAAGSSTADTSVTWFSVMVSPANPRSVETSVMSLVRDHVHGVSLRAQDGAGCIRELHVAIQHAAGLPCARIRKGKLVAAAVLVHAIHG